VVTDHILKAHNTTLTICIINPLSNRSYSVTEKIECMARIMDATLVRSLALASTQVWHTHPKKKNLMTYCLGGTF
jgi:hypothetical protein